MKTVCELDMCSGCMACLDVCPKEAIHIDRNLRAYNAVIDEQKCIDCNLCHSLCQKNNPAPFHSPISWHQGWSRDEKQRKVSASGGLAAELSKAFIKNGGVVCSCRVRSEQFLFEFCSDLNEIPFFSGSKYIKSNPAHIYKPIKGRLRNGEKVLFIGLPCQVSAVRNFVGDRLSEQLFTVDLICHGSPDPQIFQSYLKQKHLDPENSAEVSFRGEKGFRLYRNGEIIEKGVQDTYTTAFLRSMCYTENCYSCQYAQLSRVSDITLGDSWGTDLVDEEKNGVSLVLCNTEKGEELLKNADVVLFSVDKMNAISNNHQLSYPSLKHPRSEVFFSAVEKTKNLNFAMLLTEPKRECKSMIKRILSLIGINVN